MSSTSNSSDTRIKRKVKIMPLETKLYALNRLANGETRVDVGRALGIPESTLRGWCKNEQKLRAEPQQQPGGSGLNGRRRATTSPDGQQPARKRFRPSSSTANANAGGHDNIIINALQPQSTAYQLQTPSPSPPPPPPPPPPSSPPPPQLMSHGLQQLPPAMPQQLAQGPANAFGGNDFGHLLQHQMQMQIASIMLTAQSMGAAFGAPAPTTMQQLAMHMHIMRIMHAAAQLQ